MHVNPVEPGRQVSPENAVAPNPSPNVAADNGAATLAQTQPAPMTSASASNPTPQAAVPTTPVKSHSKAKGVLIALSIVILVLAGAYYYSYVKYGGVKISWAAYQFGPVNNAKISGDKAGHGASFVKPIEFSDPFNAPNPKDGLILKAYNRVNHSNQEIAGITLTEGSSPVHNAQFYKSYHAIFANPRDSRYNEALQPVKGATAFALNNAYNLNYKSMAEFKSANIADNAWVVKFNGVKTKQSASGPDKIGGSSLIVISKSATYYLTQYADTSIWNANQNTWNQVLDSLKVDQ